jgi:hypothetical protein
MNTHQKHRFLMCVVTTCIKNDGFLCMSGATCAEQRSFAAISLHQSPHAVVQYRTAICATASHKFKSCNAALHTWLSTLETSLQAELDRVSQTLTRRIRELAERYATPLPALADEVEALSAKVGEYLKKMGVVWN